MGFPIRKSADHRLFSASPRLIAAVHVLHRLLVPRHPPCALNILTVIKIFVPSAHSLVHDRWSVNALLRSVIPVIGQLCSFQGPRRRPLAQTPHIFCRAPARGRSLKTQQHAVPLASQAKHVISPVDIARSRWLVRRGNATTRLRAPKNPPTSPWRSRDDRSKSWSFPRKEVIQPHLPVRLPCYDFTPVTSPTFDGSLPCGLGHRLRVLLASVV